MNESNLNKIHVFSSEENYNENIIEVGDDDIALVPVDLEELRGPQGLQGEQGPVGATGPQGESAIISEVNATIDNNIGIPSVTVDLGGTELNRTFTFNFKNIKGEQGIQGIQGEIGPQGEQGIQGPKGDTGEMGPQGNNGISIINAEINFNNGHLILTLE